ncbi:hypothetical protein BT69DRAFT_362754 [Atractiella rhizophila]|nr:hypothetical protein BT69DRAFT_362754 [Atractiella rhizophila]
MSNSSFHSLTISTRLPLSPAFFPGSGNSFVIHSILSTFLTHYHRSLDCFLLSFDPASISFKHPLPLVPGTGWALLDVSFKGIGWRPRRGDKILGKVKQATEGHVAVLVHGLFNASISKEEMGARRWNKERAMPSWARDGDGESIVAERDREGGD